MTKRNKQTIYLIVGPTACGKTAVSIEIAKRMDGEIVSADSIQIYRGADIGSSKPTMAERQGITHHMFDVEDLSAPDFSVSKYREMAITCIESILLRGKTPIIVGGTGLYINSLTYPLSFAPSASDDSIRKALLQQEAGEKGYLHRRLSEVDPQSAARLHVNDTKRIVRALEVYQLTGKPFSSFGGDFTALNDNIPYNVHIAGLNILPREELYSRVDVRVDNMMKNGLLNEVRAIHMQGYAHNLPALQGLGYAQLLQYFDGNCTLEEAVEETKRRTRNFAKRQLTWFKRDERIKWYDVSNYQSTETLASDIIKHWGNE